MTGTIEKYFPKKQYGFVRDIDNGISYYFHNDKLFQKQLSLLGEKHSYCEFDEVEFNVRPSERDNSKYEAYELRFIRNKPREELIALASTEEYFMGQVITNDGDYFIKPKGFQLSIPLEFSVWENLSEVFKDLTKFQAFKLREIGKIDKLYAELINKSFCTDYYQLLEISTTKQIIQAIITGRNDAGLFAFLPDYDSVSGFIEYNSAESEQTANYKATLRKGDVVKVYVLGINKGSKKNVRLAIHQDSIANSFAQQEDDTESFDSDATDLILYQENELTFENEFLPVSEIQSDLIEQLADTIFYVSDLPYDFESITCFELNENPNLFEVAQQITNSKGLVINIESKFGKYNRTDHKIIELILILRLNFNYLKPIICVGFEPLDEILLYNPQDIIICSPGCKYVQLPVDTFNFESVPPITNKKEIKSFCKPFIDGVLSTLRHRSANYAGMSFMLDICKEIWNDRVVNDDDVLMGGVTNYPDYFAFKNSFEYQLLKSYYKPDTAEIDNDYLKLYKSNIRNYRILLVDDLAEKGWLPIISQMLTGMPYSENIVALSATEFTETDLRSKILEFKPHLILLDLRLDDEQGEIGISELGGFKFLNYIKSDELLKGLPVIMFTATINADNVKKLLSNGAHSVWTKPGFDEGFKSMKKVFKRYSSLIKSIERTFNSYTDNKFVYLNDVEGNLNFKIIEDIEELRIALFDRLKYYKYRIGLYGKERYENDFNNYSSIIIDTNAFVSGKFNNTGFKLEFSKTLCNLYILSYISENYFYTYILNDERKTIELPKIIILNEVLDEMIKLSKIYDNNDSKLWSRSVLAYDVFRNLIDMGLARTEMNAFDDEHEVMCVLKPPRKSSYADPEIIKNIEYLHSKTKISLGKFGFKEYQDKDTNENKYTKYKEISKDITHEIQLDNDIKKTLLITNDGDLKKILIARGDSNVDIISIFEFNTKMNDIKL